MENMIPTVAAAAVGMAIGGAAVYAATGPPPDPPHRAQTFPRGRKSFDRL